MMKRSVKLVLAFALILVIGLHVSHAWKAAVAQYHTADASLTPNLAAYAKLASKAARAGAGVLVYPEFGLGTSPGDSCEVIEPLGPNSPSTIVQFMAEVAANSSINLSVNMCEVDASTQLKYNTQVVFTRDGVVLAKYQKTHPFFKNIFATPKVPQHVKVDLAVGGELVTFGIFTCFDILFETPAVDLVHDKVFNFLYSMAMDDFAGKDAQRDWSYTYDTLLIGSNLGTHGESGIWLSGVDQSQPLSPTDASLKIADLPS
eukprot:ANDGO_04395.mRNA.1 Vanin-like protein 1